VITALGIERYAHTQLVGQWAGKRAGGENNRIDIDRASLGVNLSDPPVSGLEAKGSTGHRSTRAMRKDRTGQGLAEPEWIKAMALIRQME
jgi:hypothetical protein